MGDQSRIEKGMPPPQEQRCGCLERIGLGILRSLLSHWKGDQLVLSLPNGRRLVLGDEAGRAVEIHVHDLCFFRRLLLRSDLGFAESYMESEWSTPDLAAVLRSFSRQRTTEAASKWNLPAKWIEWIKHRLRANTLPGSRRNIVAHYDLGNDFYALWLDPGMQYSTGIFRTDQDSLEKAQDLKLRTVIEKLDLRPGMRVLEIGSGWGELGVRIVRDAGCLLKTATLSDEQFRHVQARIETEGLRDKMQVVLQDYRKLEGTFDRVVSIEMIEAVGFENLPTYFAQVEKRLAPGGKAVLEAITIPEDRYAAYLQNTDFIQTYIFPGAHCPSLQAMVDAIAQATHLQIRNIDSYAPDYAQTLKIWRERFNANWERIAALGYDVRFRKMWEYYLASCEAGFRESIIGLVQIVMEKPA